MKKIVLFTLCCVFLLGCNNQSADDEVNLSKLQSLEEGVLFSFDLTGVDLNSKNSGLIEVSIGEPEMHAGVLTRIKRVTLNIVNDEIPSIFDGFPDSTLPWNTTVSLDTDGNLISLLEITGNICTSTSPDKLPSNVHVGDSGSLSPLACIGDETRYRSWKIENAENGAIKVVITSTSKDQYGVIGSVSEVVYVLDAAGNVIGFETELEIRAHPMSSHDYISRVRLYSH